MINSILDRLLSVFTHFVFIFIDTYIHLRITVRESIVSKPLINTTKFKKYFVLLDGATFSKFYLIPNSAHFNVIENPESCAAAVYNFINLENNNLNGENDVS